MSYPFLVENAGKPRTCVVLTSSHAIHSNSGANLRLSAVIRILVMSGFEVEILTAKKLRASNSSKRYDLGVLVSFAQIKNYFNLKKVTSNLWLDSTDSLIGTRILGLGRFRVSSYLNGIIEILLALLLGRNFFCVTYISKRDKNLDRFLFRKSPKFVFPNNRLERIKSDNPSSEVTIFFVGDISYNANRKAIKFIEKQMIKIPLKNKNGVTIVSNKRNNNRKISFRNGNTITYRQNLSTAELYGENTIHIVPIWNAVGIKNKIEQPASLGRRVVAGAPSFNGLIFHEHMTPVIQKSDFFPTLNKILCQDFRAYDLSPSVIETDQSFELVEFLHSYFN
jgi:hypothetical protein